MLEEWMNKKEYFITYKILINAAQHQGFATYQEIAQELGLPTAGNYMGKIIGELLGLVSKNEFEHGRPMLSAIAVGVSGKPGEGFLNWAKEIDAFKEGDTDDTFWENECKRIYDEWKIPYKLSKTN